ncbi:MAG: hypothetical protein AVDCRST_MAG91-3422, partial [uncultured Sphingomonadaceae bacterium]
ERGQDDGHEETDRRRARARANDDARGCGVEGRPRGRADRGRQEPHEGDPGGQLEPADQAPLAQGGDLDARRRGAQRGQLLRRRRRRRDDLQGARQEGQAAAPLQGEHAAHGRGRFVRGVPAHHDRKLAVRRRQGRTRDAGRPQGRPLRISLFAVRGPAQPPRRGRRRDRRRQALPRQLRRAGDPLFRPRRRAVPGDREERGHL